MPAQSWKSGASAPRKSGRKTIRASALAHELLLQSLEYFFRSPQRGLHVVANIFLSNDFREFRLMNQLRWLLTRSTKNQRPFAGVQLFGNFLDSEQSVRPYLTCLALVLDRCGAILRAPQ